MNSTKIIIGIILLTIGIGIIAWGIFASYEIFTAKKPAPEIFPMPKALENISQPQISNPKAQTQEELQTQLTQEIKETLSQQFSSMFPPDFLAKIFNLSAWSIFVFILIYAGGKVAGIGVKLISAQDKNDTR